MLSMGDGGKVVCRACCPLKIFMVPKSPEPGDLLRCFCLWGGLFWDDKEAGVRSHFSLGPLGFLS